MNNFEIIHSILIDYIYNGDQLIFELELNKIDDEKLKIGLLFELLLKSTLYEVDKDKIYKIIQLQSLNREDINTEVINDYHKYFIDYHPYHKSTSVSDLTLCISFLEILKKYPDDIIWMDEKEIIDNVKLLTPNASKYLKNLLINSENYQEVVYLDKCLELV